MMYWITGYLKSCFLCRREIRSGGFLTCLGMVIFIILVGGITYFLGDIIFGGIEGVVNDVWISE